MRRFWLGLFLGFCLPLSAGTLTEPPPLKPELRDVYLYFKQLARNMHAPPVVTSNPNGSRRGRLGDKITYNNAGSIKDCVNNSSTGEGTSWVCAPSAYTAP